MEKFSLGPVTVPAFITFTEGGGIDGTVLRDIFRRLDALKLFDADREKGLTPFVLLDGHQSRFDVEFLTYINQKKKQIQCIGVPYRTALWQVADSAEQNGVFKVELARRKKELFESRLDSLTYDLQLLKTDIIPLVRKAWPMAFGRIRNNLNAISERGWNPYNRNLLLHPSLRAKMTEEMIQNERDSGIFPLRRMSSLFNTRMVDEGGTVFT